MRRTKSPTRSGENHVANKSGYTHPLCSTAFSPFTLFQNILIHSPFLQTVFLSIPFLSVFQNVLPKSHCSKIFSSIQFYRISSFIHIVLEHSYPFSVVPLALFQNILHSSFQILLSLSHCYKSFLYIQRSRMVFQCFSVFSNILFHSVCYTTFTLCQNILFCLVFQNVFLHSHCSSIFSFIPCSPLQHCSRIFSIYLSRMFSSYHTVLKYSYLSNVLECSPHLQCSRIYSSCQCSRILYQIHIVLENYFPFYVLECSPLQHCSPFIVPESSLLIVFIHS